VKPCCRQQRQDTALRSEVMLCYMDSADPSDLTRNKKWVGRLRAVHLVPVVTGGEEQRSISVHTGVDWEPQKSGVDCSV